VIAATTSPLLAQEATAKKVTSAYYDAKAAPVLV
jgi:hypothetical protein